jgi:predicted amidohydrolase
MFSASDADCAVVEFGGWRVGMLICYDVEFPENTRELALRGTDLIVVPTATIVQFDVVATNDRASSSIREPSVCGIRQLLRLRGREYCGLSCAAAPDGRTRASRA